MKKNILILLLTIFSFTKPAEESQSKKRRIENLAVKASQRKLNHAGKELADNLPKLSMDIVRLVGSYVENNWFKVHEFQQDFGEKVIVLAQLKNGYMVYGTENRIIICNNINQKLKEIKVDKLHSLVCDEEGFVSGHTNGIIVKWNLNGDVQDIVGEAIDLQKFSYLTKLKNGNFYHLLSGSVAYLFSLVFEVSFENKSLTLYAGNFLKPTIQLEDGYFVRVFEKCMRITTDNLVNKIEPIQIDSSIISLVDLKNNFFASGHSDGSIRIWSYNGELIQEIHESDQSQVCLTLLNDGSFASVDSEGVIRVCQRPKIGG